MFFFHKLDIFNSPMNYLLEIDISVMKRNHNMDHIEGSELASRGCEEAKFLEMSYVEACFLIGLGNACLVLDRKANC